MRGGGLALGSIAAALVLIGAPAGYALPWGPYDGAPYDEEPRFANNSTHVFCYNNLGSVSVDVADDARINALGEPTNMTTDRDCGVPRVDVVVTDSDYGPTGWRGAYSCRFLDDANNCGNSDVYVNLYYVSDADQRRKTMCHEFGHSVGLRHDTDSGCMQSGSSTARRYTDHEEMDHINARY